MTSWTQTVQYRPLTTAAGFVFQVPEHITRVDDAHPAGWQLRYGEWTYYADYSADRSGVEKALQLAITEMVSRIEYRGK